MDIRILTGRDVNEFDTASSRKVLVVNEVFARRFFGQPYGSVLGRPVRSVAEPGYPEAIYEVVGVVTDTKYSDLRDEMPAIAYVPLMQHPSLRSLKGLVFRTAAPLAPVLAEVRRRVATRRLDARHRGRRARADGGSGGLCAGAPRRAGRSDAGTSR